uniref:Uncharacterized protein n=1 Tax=Leersia perrieri TaxID=77586 RepID=A0A0D9WW44_9ORYZ
MGKVILSDVDISMMEQGKMTCPRNLPHPDVAVEREGLDATTKLCLTIFVSTVSLGVFVACLVYPFVSHLNTTEKLVAVFMALVAAAFGITGYNLINNEC